jgi:SAM-dependent methyltransferase
MPRDFRQLNQVFYYTIAAEFSRSREALNPGIQRALAQLDLANMLDVGCGDGRVSKALPAESRYVGLDFSQQLIGRNARRGAAFALTDISHPLPLADSQFGTVVCFAALHHLPNRAPLVQELARVLAPSGRLVISVWQIAHDARMRRKIVEDLGNGDYILNWRSGGDGLRFVHEVSETELQGLAVGAGLETLELYRSDGKSSDLGLYGVFKK